jgi:hypothetical protein
MIGGTDIVLKVRSDAPAADVILRTVRRHWPQCLYEDADDEAVPVYSADGTWPPQLKSREFFLYRDEEAARSWDEYGAASENDNLMLHVILPHAVETSVQATLTLVCGEPVGEMGALIDDIRRQLE